jgi:hypothetical protein
LIDGPCIDQRSPEIERPIGFPRKKYGPLTRKPVAEVTYLDGWGKKWQATAP